MDTVLVTGGAGYIGSFTCEALKNAGFRPVTYDNLSTGHKENIRWGPFVYGDILDKKKLVETFTTYAPIAVIHFAASSLVIESILNPAKYYQNNIQGLVNLLETMKMHRTKYMVFSSSCATYGEAQTLPIAESHPQKPLSPYGKSKYMGEQILEDYQMFSIEHVSLRYFNAAGAALDGSLGENHCPETHVIPLLIDLALGKKDSFTVYGNDLPTKDKTAVRDYIHVKDLATAHTKALLYLLQKNGSISLNLGTGKGHTIKDLIAAVESHCQKKLPIHYGLKRAKEPAALIADPSLAKKKLLFTCQYSDLKTIIQSAFLWHENLVKLQACN